MAGVRGRATRIAWDGPARATALTDGSRPELDDGTGNCAALWVWADAQVAEGWRNWVEIGELLGCKGNTARDAVDRRRAKAGMEPRVKTGRRRRRMAAEGERTGEAPVLPGGNPSREGDGLVDLPDVPEVGKLDPMTEDLRGRLAMAFGFLAATGQLARFGEWVVRGR